jgi:hypothetical protein
MQWGAKQEYLDRVKVQIEQKLGCRAYFLRTDTVHEEIEGNPIWFGEVELFGLIGHAEASHCFAWGHEFDRSSRGGEIVVFLEISPIEHAYHAVRTQLSTTKNTTLENWWSASSNIASFF